MRTTLLPFSLPFIGEEEIAEVVDTLRSGWITTGPKVKRFEEEFSSFLGSPAALALNSGTAALHVALKTLGIGPGDVVMTSPMTFCSTVNVIEHVGAHPLLADVEEDTLNLDPGQLEVAIEEWTNGGERFPSKGRLKAIVPVHLYGHPCDLDALTELAGCHGLAMIEDAAHALPAKYRGEVIGSKPSRRVGQHPEVPVLSCFSFYATKNLTTVEGGMLTGTPERMDDARIWSLHGMSKDAWRRYSAEGTWYYEVTRCGFKDNMTDVQAAVGLHQLRKLPHFFARRREIVARYNAAFSQLSELQVPTQRPEVEHAWHLYVLRLNLEALTLDRARFIAELHARNIGTSVHFIPVHLHPYYRDKYGYKPEDFPVAYREYQRIVSLPLYPKMTDGDVQDVIDTIYEIVRKYRR
jgi:dTDP-4-amino-4,6-dideoxygalactose transaminase